MTNRPLSSHSQPRLTSATAGGRVPRLALMDRYILSLLTLPFLFCVLVFSGIGISAGSLLDLVRQITDTQLPLILGLQLLGLQIPYFISFALPISILLAALITFNRLRRDSELVALRSSGISLQRLILPVLLFGLLVTGLNFAFNETLVPLTQREARFLLEETAQQGRANFQEQDVFYQEYGPDREVKRIFYARQFDGQVMRDLTMLDFTQATATQVITAESAAWDVATSTWTFINGTIYVVTADGSYQNTVTFAQQQLQVPRDPLNLDTDRNVDEMNILEAQRYLQIAQQMQDTKKIRNLQIRIQQRLAVPWNCLVFGVLGFALATSRQQQRSGQSSGFGLSLMFILGHYLVSFLTDAFSHSGLLAPSLGAWLPPSLGAAIAVWLLIRST